MAKDDKKLKKQESKANAIPSFKRKKTSKAKSELHTATLTPQKSEVQVELVGSYRIGGNEDAPQNETPIGAKRDEPYVDPASEVRRNG